MSLHPIKKKELQDKQKMFELLYNGEHIRYATHLTGGQLLGFVYSGQWPDWGLFAEFFRSRGLRIPKSGNPFLTFRELSENERRIVTTYVPELQHEKPAAELQFKQQEPFGEQLPLLQLFEPVPTPDPRSLQGTGYDER
jgi:hypothetical protein